MLHAIQLPKTARPKRLITAILPVALIIALTFALSFTSCGKSMDKSTEIDQLTHEFLDHVFADRYEAAYRMVEETVEPADFKTLWDILRSLTDGATSYDLEWQGLQTNFSNNDPTTTQQTYLVTFDNERSVTLRVLIQDGVDGIAGLHFTEVTALDRDFSTVNVILFAVSLLFLAFRVWMFADCIRRKPARQVLWCILILLSVTFTVTVGNLFHLRFGVSIWDEWSFHADPVAYGYTLTVGLPIAAIIYFFRRKKFTLPPANPTFDLDTDPIAPMQGPTDSPSTDATAPSDPPASDSATSSADSPTDTYDL